MSYEFVASWAGTIATVIFALFFLGVLIFIFRPGSTKTYRELSRVPLDDDDEIGNGKNG